MSKQKVALNQVETEVPRAVYSAVTVYHQVTNVSIYQKWFIYKRKHISLNSEHSITILNIHFKTRELKQVRLQTF